MSKSMAIDGIMKIFLMVAVIIVGMSFLMKAFGVDLLGWLQEKLGGFEIKDGKILYMKLDPGDKPPEFFSIYLTNNPIQKIEHGKTLDFAGDDYFAYFMVDKDTDLFKKNCLIYTVDEIGLGAFTTRLETKDEAFVYYAKPGTVIQDQTCNSLQNCLSGKIAGSDCKKDKEKSGFCESDITGVGPGDLDKCYQKKKGPFATVNCYCESRALKPIPNEESKCEDSQKDVETFSFDRQIKRVEDCELKGGNTKTPNKCNLLVPEDVYRIKYGLLCDSNGVWRVCKQDNKGTPSTSVTIPNKKYNCEVDGEKIGRWELIKEVAPLPAAQAPVQPSASTPPQRTAQLTADTTAQSIEKPVKLTVSATDSSGKLNALLLDPKSAHESCRLISETVGAGHICGSSETTSCSNTWEVTCATAGKFEFQGSGIYEDGFVLATNKLPVTFSSTASPVVPQCKETGQPCDILNPTCCIKPGGGGCRLQSDGTGKCT